MNGSNKYRTIWLSDFHLGTRDCKAEYLLEFLRENESENLYLVGDVIDGWALGRSWHWRQPFNDVVQKLLRKARKGTRVIYIPGNHDEFAREFLNLMLGEIQILRNTIHTTADNRRLLVLHGDEFDSFLGHARWFSLLGAWAYELCLRLNRGFNFVRRHLNLPYRSLAAYLKHRAKRAVQFIADFENAVVMEAGRQDVDGVVCGHIHHAELRMIDRILYANTGDWVESCTALVEHFDGTLEIVRWTDARRQTPPREAIDSIGDGAFVESTVSLSVPNVVLD